MINNKDILDDAKNYCDKHIRPYANDFDEDGYIPIKTIKQLAQKSYLSASIPKEYGGLGLTPLEFGHFIEGFGKACCNIRTLITVNSIVGETILKYGTEFQKNNLLVELSKGNKIAAFALSEPEVGSDAKNIKTTYEKIDDKYILKGKKKWISFGALADYILIIARKEEEITAFLVSSNAKGIEVTETKGMMANRASFLAEINIDNVEVNEDNILGPIGGGFNHIVSYALDYGRYCVAWGGLAVMQECVDSLVTYSRNRRQFGTKIYKNQLIQGMIGDAVTKLHAGRSLCVNAAKLRTEGKEDSIIETSVAKYFTSKAAVDISDKNLQINGAHGFSNKSSASRLYREAKILEIIEGTSQIQQQIIANYGLRKYYNNNLI